MELSDKIAKAKAGIFTNNLNQKKYFVCNNLCDEWIELPFAEANMIEKSLKTQKYLTGNLQAQVNWYSNFIENEKHYLRAIITRITHSTNIHPSHGAEINSLLKPNYWLHRYPKINSNGLIEIADFHVGSNAKTNTIISNQNEIEELSSELMNQENQLNNFGEHKKLNSDILTIDPLQTCAYDIDDEGKLPWKFTTFEIFSHSSQIILAESLLWKGSYSVATNEHEDNIYFGWGLKEFAKYWHSLEDFSVEKEFFNLELEQNIAKRENAHVN